MTLEMEQKNYTFWTTKGNKQKKKMNRASGTCGYNRISNINMIGVLEKEERKSEAKKVLKDKMAKTPPNLAEDKTTY